MEDVFTGCHRNNTGSTPLHLAAAMGHYEVVEYLLQQPGIVMVQVGHHWHQMVHSGPFVVDQMVHSGLFVVSTVISLWSTITNNCLFWHYSSHCPLVYNIHVFYMYL